MAGRFRKTDLFALMGLLLLLVWTPSYIASDDEVRELSDGERFELPPPRDGDRVVFEFVVREQGKEPQVVGPIGMMERRLATPGEAPGDPVWVEEWTYYPGEWDLSIGELRMGSRSRAIYYGSDGLPVWYAYEAHERNEGLYPATRASGSNNDRGGYRYTSDVTYGSMDELVQQARRGDDGRVLTEALRHRGEVLFGGAGTAARVLDRFVDVGDSGLSHLMAAENQIILPWEFHNRGNLHFNGTVDHFSVEEWKWYDQEAAAAVGYHFAYAQRGQRPFLHIDILPRAIESGTGEALPLVASDADPNIGNAFPRTLDATNATTELMTPLRSIDQDVRPVLDGVSLPTLRIVLQDHPAWKLALDEGAHIVGFAAEQRPVGTNWTLLLLDEEDRVTIGSVRLGDDTDFLDGHIFCSDLEHPTGCSGVAGINEPFTCHSLHTIHGVCPDPNPDPMDLDRSVPDPWFLWASAETPVDGWERVTFAPEPDVARIGPNDSNGFQAALRTLSPERGEVHPHLGFTQVEGKEEVPLLRWNLMDGGLDRHISALTEGETAAPLAIAIEEGPLARPLGAVPVTIATGGIVLLAVSALARSWATLRMFGLAGLAAFYARVQDEDVLAHARREEILQVLRAEPGLTATEVSGRLMLAWGVTAHHLERLRKAGLVHVRKDGRRRHHFPADAVAPESLLAARNPDYHAFLEAVAETPGISLRDVEHQLGRTRSALSRTGSRLVRLGLLEKRRDGMVMRFYPPEGTAGKAKS